jgi:hypothetical protein
LSLIANAMAAAGGGSELYRVDASGYAEKIWSSPSDVVYAIGFGDSGVPLIGTGNKGVVYRVDSNTVTTQLVNAPPTQVTAFARGKNGTLYAATGNVGKLYALGPKLEQTGSFESEVLDASGFATWGKIHLLADLRGGKAEIATRSGNVNRPQKNWSDWEPVALSPNGGTVKSPPARFLQYRVTLSAVNESPVLQTVQIAFLPKNIAPVVRLVQIEDANYRAPATPTFLERNTAPSGSPVSRTLPAVGQPVRSPSPSSSESSGSLTVQYAKGFITARWTASDDNGDSLIYQVEIQGKAEKVWRLLKDRLQERYISFDGTAFPDGEYAMRITASDEPSNARGEALTGSMVSDFFTIDNTPPELTNNGITSEGKDAVIRFSAKDKLSWIDKAEYSVNGAEWQLLEPQNKVSDSQQLDYELRVPNDRPGEQRVIAVRVFDENDNSSVIRFILPVK